jgi:hypothetical protein
MMFSTRRPVFVLHGRPVSSDHTIPVAVEQSGCFTHPATATPQ